MDDHQLNIVTFHESRLGMHIVMAPGGCKPGSDRFTGRIVGKDDDTVMMQWNSEAEGGPPVAMLIPLQRPEEKEWWDGEARPVECDLLRVGFVSTRTTDCMCERCNPGLATLAAHGYTRSAQMCPVLQRIIRESVPYNARVGITGFLINCPPNFFQVLVGPEESVREVLKKIEHDPDHRGVDVVMRRVPRRGVPYQWNMASFCPTVRDRADGMVKKLSTFEFGIRMSPLVFGDTSGMTRKEFESKIRRLLEGG
jgi:hypothetical protein